MRGTKRSRRKVSARRSADLASVKMNCLVSDISLTGIKVNRYRFMFKTSEEIDPYRMGSKVSRVIRGVFTVPTGGTNIYTLSDKQVPGLVHVDGMPVEIEGPFVEELDPQHEAHRRLVNQYLRTEIRKRLQSLGYDLEEYNILYKRTSVNTGNIEAHDAVTYQVQFTPKGRVLLFVDLQKRWVCRLDAFLGSLKGMTQEERIDFLMGREVMVHSRSSWLNSMKVVEYHPDKHGTYILDQSKGTTLYQYWANPPDDKRARLEGIKAKLSYDPKKEDRGVFVLSSKKGLSSQWSYPPQVLRIKIDLQDDELLKHLDTSAKKETISPSERERKINDIFEVLSAETFQVDRQWLDFSDGDGPRWGTLTELSKDGYHLVDIDIPWLEYRNRYRERFRKKGPNDALQHHGPYSGPKDLTVDILLPSNGKDRMVPSFFRTIARLYERHNLGTLTLGKVIVGGETPAAYGAMAADLYNDLLGQGTSLRNRFLIAILPDRDKNTFHHVLNNELKIVNVKSKCMLHRNFVRFDSQARFHLFNIIACIYDRSLEVGEAMWILGNGAGESGPADKPLGQVFVGFDVSRVRGKPEIASYATVCEPHGRVMDVQDKSFSGEYLTATDVEDILTGTIAKYQHIRKMLHHPLTEEIVFFKDGTSRGEIQGRDIEDGLERTATALVDSGRATSDVAIHYVDVTKGIIHRIFTDDGKAPEGTCIINEGFNHPEAVLITTDPMANLTPSPNRLTLRKSVGGSEGDIERIARQFFDLRFLHWETWLVQPGSALPLHIVQHKAWQRAHGYDTAYTPK